MKAHFQDDLVGRISSRKAEIKRRNSGNNINERLDAIKIGPIRMPHPEERKKAAEADIFETFIYEDAEQDRICFLFNSEHRLYYTEFKTKYKNGKPVTKAKNEGFIKTATGSQIVRGITKINRNNYIFDYKDGQQVFKLTINAVGYQTEVAYVEQSY